MENNGLLELIINAALESRASDIHLYIDRNFLAARFRIDGLLHPYQDYELAVAASLISRIKILSKLDIAEHRLPQDGHFEFEHEGQVINIRVSVLPTIYGEAVVLRLHSREMLLGLNNMGFDQAQLILVHNLINSRSGMILTTGPTGSGKTTILYSALNQLNDANRNIMTIEDPIELQMAGIRQTQVNDGINMTFAKILRSAVRQDPDVIMLGEIRDDESAQISIQAALSGILVLSTFHTFDVPALVTRFMEMRIPPSVVAQSIRGVISCRLVRMICPHCQINYQPNNFELNLIQSLKNTNLAMPNEFKKGVGCKKCLQKGYLGRTGLFEVLFFDEQIRLGLIERKPISYIAELIKQKGVQSLKQSGLEKVRQGITTLEEVARVVDLFG